MQTNWILNLPIKQLWSVMFSSAKFEKEKNHGEKGLSKVILSRPISNSFYKQRSSKRLVYGFLNFNSRCLVLMLRKVENLDSLCLFFPNSQKSWSFTYLDLLSNHKEHFMVNTTLIYASFYTFYQNLRHLWLKEWYFWQHFQLSEHSCCLVRCNIWYVLSCCCLRFQRRLVVLLIFFTSLDFRCL